MKGPPRVRIEPLGECALVFEAGDRAPRLVVRLRESAPDWVTDVVPAFGRIMVGFDPLRSDQEAVAAFCRQACDSPDTGGSPPRSHTVPVCYELGEDLEDVCNRLGTTHREFVSLHSCTGYECRAIGFCPGFPYLGWLHDRIAGLPRRASPRLAVPVGSVAVTMNLTGVYTVLRPGGWWLVGKTPLRLCVPEEDRYPISVGDTVRFEPVSPVQFEARDGEVL